MFYAENLEHRGRAEHGQVLGQNFCDIFEIFRANRAARLTFFQAKYENECI